MYAPTGIEALWTRVHHLMPATELGGITGDARHVEEGGYHISRSLLMANGMSGDYSIEQAIDKLGDPDAASALDVTMGETPLMHTVTNRLLAAKHDPRMKPIREFFGCQHTGGPIVGWDWSYGGPTTSDDLSHRWHVHLSVHRKYVNDNAALMGVADVMAGIPLHHPTTEDIMAGLWDGHKLTKTEEAEKSRFLADVRAAAAAGVWNKKLYDDRQKKWRPAREILRTIRNLAK